MNDDMISVLARQSEELIKQDAKIAEAAARIAQLEAALRGAEAWLQNWAVHARSCEAGNRCTCGLAAIRFDVSAALEKST